MWPHHFRSDLHEAAWLYYWDGVAVQSPRASFFQRIFSCVLLGELKLLSFLNLAYLGDLSRQLPCGRSAAPVLEDRKFVRGRPHPRTGSSMLLQLLYVTSFSILNLSVHRTLKRIRSAEVESGFATVEVERLHRAGNSNPSRRAAGSLDLNSFVDHLLRNFLILPSLQCAAWCHQSFGLKGYRSTSLVPGHPAMIYRCFPLPKSHWSRQDDDGVA